MRPEIQSFFDEATFTVTYLVSDPATKVAAVIDSVLDYDPKSGRTSTNSADAVLAAAKRADLRVEWILETHAHADHLSAGAYLRGKTGAKIAIGDHITTVQKTFKPIFNVESQKIDGSDFDRLLKDGEHVKLGNLNVEVLYTPGHTPACVSYKIGDAVFVGDTLFMPDYGTARADFPGGDARTLYRSIKGILSLPAETRLFMCHDYKAPGRETFAWETTVRDERAKNVQIRDGISEDEFVAMRNERDKTLAMPVLILPSIQVNIRAGSLPPPETNGTSYLKIPLNKL
ncbi:MAG: MBL fold metallo-hydrolase [Alphaproteobacteria bacterium]|nr:MBL fold metallo-hydrolase [Alphaproteobacteria bacterium]